MSRNVVEMNLIAATTTDEWREWLAQNGQSEKEIWLVIQHKDSPTASPRYHEAIEHALCFGWIDGLHRSHDADSSALRFTPRSPRSTWSRTNRERAQRMIEQGLMTEHGQRLIDLARRSGTWQVMSDEDSSSVPEDLQAHFGQNPLAFENFQKFPAVFETADPGMDRRSEAAADPAAPNRPDRALGRSEHPSAPPRGAPSGVGGFWRG